MDEEYNVLATEENDETLVYPTGPEDVVDDSALMALNEDGKRKGKRRLAEMENYPPDSVIDHPIDWHMRMPCTFEEREAKRRREEEECEAAERLSFRILDARRRRRAAAGEAVEDAGKDEDEPLREMVMRCPPVDGSRWMGVSSDGCDYRLYIRLHPRARLLDQAGKRAAECRNAVLGGKSSAELDREVAKLRKERSDQEASRANDMEWAEPAGAESVRQAEEPSTQRPEAALWVTKYTPRNYLDLLSDEAINRTVLTWLRLWDECVWKRKSAVESLELGEKEQQLFKMDDSKPRRPHHKVLLLSGPAGLGKTTLATLIAKQAGYSVIDVNASDQRNIADFDRVLEGAVRSVRTIDQVAGEGHGKPVCLILDEIDGAGDDAIRHLLKALAGTGRQAVRRPIICICNNPFAKCLRELRGVALCVQMTATKMGPLTGRLAEIAGKEKVRVDGGALQLLAERAECDVRLCVNTLQYVAAAAKQTGNIVGKDDVMQALEREHHTANIFKQWSTVLEYQNHHDSKGGLVPLLARSRAVQRVAWEAGGEYFVSGLHLNYLRTQLPMSVVKTAADCFVHYDLVNQVVAKSQNYVLMKYLFSFYVKLHLTVATHAKIKQFVMPTTLRAMRQREAECMETIRAVRLPSEGGGGWAAARGGVRPLLLHTLPMLVHITQPPIKSMNQKLCSSRDLAQIAGVVSAMRDYGLDFVHTLANGEMNWLYKPAIDVLTMFPVADESGRHMLANTTRQMIHHQIEIAEMRGRQEEENAEGGANEDAIAASKKRREKIMQASKNPMSAAQAHVPLHYKYNQGFSNAVKKNIRMSQLIM